MKTFKFYLLCFSLITSISLNAQVKKKHKTGGGFGSTQWWIGAKAGINICKAAPLERFAVISQTTAPYDGSDKEYAGYGKAGTEIGVITTFDFGKFLSFSLQPSILSTTFSYKNNYIWQDSENPANSLELDFDHQNTLTYLETPLLLKVNFFRGKNRTNMRTGTNQRQTLKPYIQAGIFYGRLLNANKEIKVSAIDNASGASEKMRLDDENAGIKDLFIKSQFGIMGGGGISYDVGSLRLSLEANYKQGLNNIVNEKNRFFNDRLSSGAGDVFDNLTLQNINVQLLFTFPMKFITSRDFVPINP